jgi:SAM-dependent methyltransferase
MLRELLSHPLTKGLDIDDPRTTNLRKRIILEKPFLRQLYEEWYHLIASKLPLNKGGILELGAGAGFMEDMVPHLVKSEIFYCEGIHAVLDALKMPFADRSLTGIVMTDVLHHLPDVKKFFSESSRCLDVGGKIVMIEPWVTPWSKLVYTRLHHEPFKVEAEEWKFPAAGPLSGANGALPWIIFQRDREQFEAEFPDLIINDIKLIMPFSYLLSGGVSMRNLAPGWGYKAWRGFEEIIKPCNKQMAMFACIDITRK